MKEDRGQRAGGSFFGRSVTLQGDHTEGGEGVKVKEGEGRRRRTNDRVKGVVFFSMADLIFRDPY